MPIMVPMIFLVLAMLIQPYADTDSSVLFIITEIFLVLSLPVFGFFPYILFAFAVLVWGRRKTFEQQMKASVYLPPLFSLLLMIVVALLGWRSGNGLQFSIMMALCPLVYGYVFVVMAHILNRVAKKRGECASQHNAR